MNQRLLDKIFQKEREYFLNVFIKGTYKKRSLYEIYGYGMFGTIGNGEGEKPTQPKVRKRYLAEDGYKGKYKPGSVHTATRDIGMRDRKEHTFKFMVIGRYFTKNLGYDNYRVRVIRLDTGKIDYITC